MTYDHKIPCAAAMLTDVEKRNIGSRLAGVCDGAVDEAVEWLTPLLESLIDQRLAPIEALLAGWDAWDGSRDGFGTSPRVRDALRAALAPRPSDRGAR